MYSGVLYALPFRTISYGGTILMIGVALGVVGEPCIPNEVVTEDCPSVAKSTFSAGGPSTRRASMSFCESVGAEVNGFLTSLATLTITSNVVACSAVGSK